MSSQYYRKHSNNDPSNDNYTSKMRSEHNVGSNRMPLRPRQINVENPSCMSRVPVGKKYTRTSSTVANTLGGHDDKGVQSSSIRTKGNCHGTSERIEIEELRRKPNGEGHTVHRYLRGKMLGKGGFAKVYTCESLDTNRMYAVKIVPKANLVKARARQKLHAEIKIHRILKHKYICEYKHFFEDKTNCYILLELCHNQSMNELIKRRKRLTEPEVKYYLSQLLQSVQYMHEINVIHRDLKLGNLFLDKQLRVKVGDLGLATKLASSDEKRKTICGTPNYIAPEVIDGNKEKRGHSFEVDIWSMGVICYTLLIGKPPYESKDVKSTYQRILANKYSFPSHVPISEYARDLISRMLQTIPDKRPSLETIRMHPFFTHNKSKIPKSLPLCCTHVAPDWQEDTNGNLVPVLAEADNTGIHTTSRRKQEYRDESKPSSHRPQKQTTNHFHIYGDTGNLPSNHSSDNVGHEVALSEDCKGADIRVVNKEPVGKQFKEALKTKPIKKSTVDIEMLTKKTSTLSLKEGSPQDNSVDGLIDCKGESTKIQKAILKDYDMKELEIMHSRLKKAITNGDVMGTPDYRPNITAQSSTITKWVTRYVDYTSKYGLGFLLNDGSAGVYFNDSTKAVLAPKGETFIYVERKKLDDGQGGNIEQVCEKHSLNSFPDSIKKKVTLLKHFRNYLIEQQKRDGDSDVDINVDLDVKNYDEDSTLFLKKWVRTRHAILFRLSDNTVQVVFYDHTEILLSSDGCRVTYVDKKRDRRTYNLEEVLITSQTDVKKRLKYAEGILQQLITCGKK